MGYKLFFISAKNKINIDEIKKYIKNCSIVLIGASGVGKSTLINALNDDDNKADKKTGTISKKTLKGTHTTRHCEIVDYEDFSIIDTPGFSKLKFDFLLPNALVDLFDDIKIYAKNCKFKNCTHDNIENKTCEVCKNLDKIDKSRYDSYVCFLIESLEYKKEISKKSIKKESLNKSISNKTALKVSKRKRNLSRNTQKQKIKDEI